MDDPQKFSGSSESKQQVSPPSISLPKGGGAIRGIGEKFAANPVTGTGSITVPIATSPGRSGFGPQLSLSYDSGAGNSPFGFGWSLSLQAIARKTDKGLPKYLDAEESDVFILSGAEDLVPFLDSNGQTPTLPERTAEENGMNRTYRIKSYRPRIEGLFARIERWSRVDDVSDVHWRSISQDNILTIYGRDENSRIFDPNDQMRIFSWLISETRDDKGNAVIYEYKAEDNSGVLLGQANERNRTRSANRYLKRIYYGNRKSLLDDSGIRSPFLTDDQVSNAGWMFEVIFDYEEGHYTENAPDDKGQVFAKAQVDLQANSSWLLRNDPFSSYRAGFEIRTYRLCKRVLMFHHIPDLPTGEKGYDGLVRSTDFTYTKTKDPTSVSNPTYTFLSAVTQSGYKKNGDTCLKRSMPPVEFEYTQPVVQEVVEEVDSASLENLPAGLDGVAFQWIDLHGEGIPGILTEQGGAWYYKRNISPISNYPVEFAPVEMVSEKPNLSMAGSQAQFMDLAGKGQPDLVVMDGPMPGFYEHDDDESWQPFRSFISRLNFDTRDPNFRFIDLDGDSHTDVLITGNDALIWHASLAEDGFGLARRVAQGLDEEHGPRIVFDDGTQSVYLADLSGDGLTDIVRIRNGEVCYWPNLGYCRFGAKVTMDNSPWFDNPDLFDHKRIRLADIDGSGTTDIIYLLRDGVRLYFNQSGNSWSEPHKLNVFPQVDNMVSVMTADLLGNGTACLVWSSPLPGDAGRQMRYVNLMGVNKPHLLVSTKNNLGAETRVDYAPSTKFYLLDKYDGKPWITRLPFPVHVVERVITYDWISRNRFVTRYAYHHGYFDGEEREFRGFGMVEQWDTEAFDALTGEVILADNIDAVSHVPPVLTKTWFHTGIYRNSDHVSDFFAGLDDKKDRGEYAREPGWLDDDDEAAKRLLPDTTLPEGLKLEEEPEACRALKGSMLRQELYALDGTDKEEYPYTVVEQNFTIRKVQPRGANRHSVFFTHAREAITYQYERNLDDPRVQHAMTLEVDDYGNVLKSVAIGYGRDNECSDEVLTPEYRQKQCLIHMTCTENSFTNPVIDQPDVYRLPLHCETRTYQLRKPQQEKNPIGSFFRYQFNELLDYVQQAGDGKHDIEYEDLGFEKARQAAVNDPVENERYFRRLIEHVRTLYRPDDLGMSRDDPMSLLPLGELQTMALPGESYKLSFTPGLLSQMYRRHDVLLLPDVSDILGGKGADQGGYLGSQTLKNEKLFPVAVTKDFWSRSDEDGHWWIPSGRAFFSSYSGDTSGQELGYARQHFYLLHRSCDPFGQMATITYDSYDFLIRETRDALGNTVVAVNDYRVQQPFLVTDPNGNQAEVRFDCMGLVAGSAVMGNPGKYRGDSFSCFESDLVLSAIDAFQSATDVHTVADGFLGTATTRIIYDPHRFYNSRMANPEEPEKWQPAFAATLARETHVSDLGENEKSKILISFSYSDGFGREIQKKVQSENGRVPRRGDDGKIIVGTDGYPEMTSEKVSPRWVGSGWTVFNNKGLPVRQYEPFFTDTRRFEFDISIGVSPVLFYDPVGRVIASLHPNHTFEKVAYDPWSQKTWDVNDTVAWDPRNDPDISGYVKEYFREEAPVYDDWKTWLQQRGVDSSNPPPDTPALEPEKKVAVRALAHADTPTIAYFDTLGRPFLTITHNRVICPGHAKHDTEEKYATCVELDIEGNQREVLDAKNHLVMRYEYNMLGSLTHQESMEAGERWILNDVAGNPIRAWDSPGIVRRMTYDELRRPRGLYVTENGAERLAKETIYGEAQGEAANHRTRIYQIRDGAGVVTSMAYDFKGNLLESRRELLPIYKDIVDWVQNPTPDDGTFTTVTEYDALNRPVAVSSPDGSVYRPVFNEANLLDKVDVNLRGSIEVTPFVLNIDYDAKGRREFIRYGNGAETRYEYDRKTFRLIHLKTTRSNGLNVLVSKIFADPAVVQDLYYTYDPVGNITTIDDRAFKTVFNGMPIDPVASYTYDAIYRLIEATGREHSGQTAFNYTPGNYRDYPFTGLADLIAHPNDPEKLRKYTERYEYDEVGNFEKFRHDANGGSYIRHYEYNEASLLEPSTRKSNRLSATSMPGDDPNGPFSAKYTYDAHGNMTSVPHLPAMIWDSEDQLQQVDLGGGGTVYYVYDAAGQRVRKVIERQNGTRKEERIYLGGFEVYKSFDDTGLALKIECDTLHIMDDKQRIAIVETKIIENQFRISNPDTLLRYQLSNHLGSSCLELDKKGSLISYEEYHPYGITAFQLQKGEVSSKRYRYTGKERDEETGFNYHGARYYVVWLGIWCSCDSVKDESRMNLYVYVKNNPVNLYDPNGREELAWYKKIGIAIEEGANQVVQRVDATAALLNDPGAVLQNTTKQISNRYKVYTSGPLRETGPSALVHAVSDVLNPIAHAKRSSDRATLAEERGDERTAIQEKVSEIASLTDALLLTRGVAGGLKHSGHSIKNTNSGKTANPAGSSEAPLPGSQTDSSLPRFPLENDPTPLPQFPLADELVSPKTLLSQKTVLSPGGVPGQCQLSTAALLEGTGAGIQSVFERTGLTRHQLPYGEPGLLIYDQLRLPAGAMLHLPSESQLYAAMRTFPEGTNFQVLWINPGGKTSHALPGFHGSNGMIMFVETTDSPMRVVVPPKGASDFRLTPVTPRQR
jgi:RHS repeat-associated protein